MTAIKQISPQELQQWLDNDEAILLDVREPDEFQAERIPRAINIPLSSVQKDSLPPHPDHKLVVHCQSGSRSSEAAKKISEADKDRKIWNLEGGIIAWKEANCKTIVVEKDHMALNRQVQIAVGGTVLIASILGYFLHPAWLFISGFFGAGLLNAGLTGWCGMAKMLSKMPWNN